MSSLPSEGLVWHRQPKDSKWRKKELAYDKAQPGQAVLKAISMTTWLSGSTIKFDPRCSTVQAIPAAKMSECSGASSPGSGSGSEEMESEASPGSTGSHRLSMSNNGSFGPTPTEENYFRILAIPVVTGGKDTPVMPLDLRARTATDRDKWVEFFLGLRASQQEEEETYPFGRPAQFAPSALAASSRSDSLRDIPYVTEEDTTDPALMMSSSSLASQRNSICAMSEASADSALPLPPPPAGGTGSARVTPKCTAAGTGGVPSDEKMTFEERSQRLATKQLLEEQQLLLQFHRQYVHQQQQAEVKADGEKLTEQETETAESPTERADANDEAKNSSDFGQTVLKEILGKKYVDAGTCISSSSLQQPEREARFQAQLEQDAFLCRFCRFTSLDEETVASPLSDEGEASAASGSAPCSDDFFEGFVGVDCHPHQPSSAVVGDPLSGTPKQSATIAATLHLVERTSSSSAASVFVGIPMAAVVEFYSYSDLESRKHYVLLTRRLGCGDRLDELQRGGDVGSGSGFLFSSSRSMSAVGEQPSFVRGFSRTWDSPAKQGTSSGGGASSAPGGMGMLSEERAVLSDGFRHSLLETFVIEFYTLSERLFFTRTVHPFVRRNVHLPLVHQRVSRWRQYSANAQQQAAQTRRHWMLVSNDCAAFHEEHDASPATRRSL